MLYKVNWDYARAEPLFKEALEIRRRALPAGHPDIAKSLNNLAGLHRDRGEYARAEPLYKQALEIDRRALPAGHPYVAVGLNNLAGLYMDTGEYARAEPLYKQALEISRKALPAGHPEIASGLGNLASLYLHMGEYARAEPLFKQALEIDRRALPAGHTAIATALNNLAMMYYVTGDRARAMPLLRQALEIVSAASEETSTVLAERARLELFGILARALGAYLTCALETRVPPETLYGYVLAWKGATAARAEEARLVRDRPELRPALDELKGARARLARLAFTAPEPGRRDAWRAQLDALRERKEVLEEQIARIIATDRLETPSARVGPAEVAAALPGDTGLVELVGYSHRIPPGGGKGAWTSQRRLLAFVVRRGRPVACVALGEAPPIARSSIR
jgi:tetratricopeptide (TPR) repeat protein